MNLNDFVYYDATSITGLRWKINVYSGINNQICLRKIGDVAGALITKKNRNQKRDGGMVAIEKNRFRIHRVIWELHHGKVPDDWVVDHLNGDPWDNRIENLCAKSRKHNSQNKSKPSTNSSGFIGITWSQVGKNFYCRASVTTLDRLSKDKRFNVKTYGLMPALYLANMWRKDEISTLNAQGACYTDRNGTTAVYSTVKGELLKDIVFNI